MRVTTNYGLTTNEWEKGDMNGDGTVDSQDSDIVTTNSGTTPTASLTAAWEWSLETLGNWKGFREDDDSTLDWDVLDQTRLHNKVNEIDDDDDHLPGDPINEGAITETQGDSWVVPGYDAAGNMLSGPKPGDEETRQHYKWDAWNRLVAVYADDDGEVGDLIATYRYDGLNRRIQKVVEGDPDVTYDYYYNESWQIVEVRKGADTDPYEQFVWCQRYIDAPVVRFRDGNTDGDLTGGTQEGDNTLYYTNDANMNVTALVDGYDGAVVERYMYDPYGKPTVLNGVRDSTGTATTEWTARTSNTFQNHILYCGYYFDDESGSYSVRHRVLLPNLGWMQRDPLRQMLADRAHGLPTDRFAGGVSARDKRNLTENLYEYVKSLPTSRYDPKGLACCGPDIGQKLRELMTQLERDFGSLPTEDAEAVCNDMVDTTGWDIREFARGCSACKSMQPDCGTSPCELFIAVDGVCHLASDVNYVLWGRMNKLCGNSEDFATGFATLYTTVQEWLGAIIHQTAPSESSNHTDPANDWTRAGYNYNGTFPVSHRHPSSKDCGICGKDYEGELHYEVGAGLRALLHLRHGISGGTGEKEPPEMQKRR